MGRLFIFSNGRRVDEFAKHIAMPDDDYLLFENRVSSEYKLNGGPINVYSLASHQENVVDIYNLFNSRNSTAQFQFKYSEKTRLLNQLSNYTEICIVSVWGVVDDYFVSLYNYLLGLSNFKNDCLPISVCEPETDLFENRQSLANYMEYAPQVKKYYNKEYMNIAVIDNIQSIYNVDLTFDEMIMMTVIDKSMYNLTHCPSYYIYNNLNNNLVTIDGSYRIFEHFYKMGYFTNYAHEGNTCVSTLEAYTAYKEKLLSQRIDYKCIYDTFENASNYEHNKFKTHINQYFETLANNILQEHK